MPLPLLPLAPSVRTATSAAIPRLGDLPWIAGYALAFACAHHIAAGWGGQGYYSLLYPAAGVRLALLWSRGPRLTISLIAMELVVQTIAGIIVPGQPGWLTASIGVARPALTYGIVVWLVRHLAARSSSSLGVAPMPLGLAAVTAPVAAALVSLPWSLLSPELTGVVGLRQTLASLTGFAVGDMLGVLLVAPPLLWVIQAAQDRTLVLHRPAARHVAALGEAAAVLGAAIVASLSLVRIGLGTPATPALLAVAWIGLRFGRTASWWAILIVAAIVLPYTATGMSVAERLALHMSLASIVVVGYLAGSFADAQARAQTDLSRRDRLLFQAERLKTLRAMSVAVIHEISQPLSTLAIEAKHLHEITVSADPEIAQTSALIDRKAAALSTLVRRLRRFGGRAVDEPSALPVSALIENVAALTSAEAKAAGVVVEVVPIDPDLVVLAQEIELAQAIINLVRNAVQACDGHVVLSANRHDDQVVVTVAN
ncbi:sensor histidine kinase [Sphingomonas sp. CV7422]|uniref:sensor histidine kinase n=1 Tax=Sphingomonas sp. CV7422 TaxID=3018036 RepID=UPI0022FE38F3|nr:sensor histidine kinase [Sphingomonas sp. CV7422]